jgi:hypothetical protein
MATFTAIGPALDLSAPTPQAPCHSLLMTPGVVAERDGGRWLNGVNYWQYPEATPSAWDPCDTGTFRTKDEGEGMGSVRFDTVVGYLAITCSAIGMGAEEVQEFFDRAEAALDATLSFAAEELLAAGNPSSSNPFLSDSDMTTPGGSTAVSPGIGLSILENAIGATGKKGMIHATPATIAALQAFPLGGDTEMERLETANCTPVVSGGGYIATRPVGHPPTGATEDWMFASLPVEVRLSPMVATTVAQTLDRSDNVLTYRAERAMLVSFDAQLQAGVLVDWST